MSTPQPPWMRPPSEPTRGRTELFGASDDPGQTSPLHRVTEASTPRASIAAHPHDRRILVGAAVLVVLLLGAAVVVWAVRQGGAERPPAAPTSQPAAPPYGLTERATRSDTDCAEHAYGDAEDFFDDTPCAGLDRALYVSADGSLVVSVAIVEMPDVAAATELKSLLDTDGTGNVADLLRDGVTVVGVPDQLSDAGYASRQEGAFVTVVEADFTDEDRDDTATLDGIAAEALVLGVSP